MKPLRPLASAVLGAALLLLAPAGCISVVDSGGGGSHAGRGGGRDWVRTELYFGLGADDAAWERFLAEVVTPAFPDGLTVLAGHGQWRSRQTGEIERQPARVLVLVHEDTAPNGERVELLRRVWRERTGDESVLLVQADVEARF